MSNPNITRIVPIGTALSFFLPGQARNHTAVQLAAGLIETIKGNPPAGFQDVNALGAVRNFLGANMTEEEILNFLDGFQYLPKDRLHGQMAPGFVLLAIAGLFVFLRLSSRWVLNKSWARWDDLSVVLAWVFSAAFVISHNTKDMEDSVQLHVWNITLPQIKAILYMRFWSNFAYVLTLAFVKWSFLFLYYQISANRGFRVVFWIMAVIITLSSLSLFLINFFLCKPMDTWNHFLTVKCVDMAAVYTWGGTMNIITDVMIFVFPIPLVYSLHMDRRGKWTAIGMFACGFLVCIASVIRLFTVKHFANYADITTAALPTMHLAQIETNLGIIVACLPSLRKLFEKLFFPAQRPETYEDRSRRMNSATAASASLPMSQKEEAVQYIHHSKTVDSDRSGNTGKHPQHYSAYYISDTSDDNRDGGAKNPCSSRKGSGVSEDDLQIVKTSRVSVHVDDPGSREMCDSPGCRRGSAVDANEATAEAQMQRDLEKGHNHSHGPLMQRGETFTICVVGGKH